MNIISSWKNYHNGFLAQEMRAIMVKKKKKSKMKVSEMSPSNWKRE